MLQRLRKIDPVVGFFTGTIAVSIWIKIAGWWDPLGWLDILGMEG